jgi:hypothetical protein
LEEPLVSVSVDGQTTAFLGDGKKEEPYKPRHTFTGRELEQFALVLWVKQAVREHSKYRRDEALKMTFSRQVELRAKQEFRRSGLGSRPPGVWTRTPQQADKGGPGRDAYESGVRSARQRTGNGMAHWP